MKTKLFFVLASLMMLMSTSAMAQSETIKGDVNGDGIVDVADIAAVIKIMTENGDIKKKYYWYVGQENPAKMTSISPIVDDNTSPGWRLIGTSKPTSSTFTSTNMLWNGVENEILFSSRDISYIAIPYKPLQMWDVTTNDGMFYTIQNNGNTININGVDYYVYISDYKTRSFGMNIFNK